MRRILNRKRTPGPIKKGECGIYWDSRSGPYYGYDGESDYAFFLFFPNHKVPISSLKRVYRLTRKEVELHIADYERGIRQIRAEKNCLERNLNLLY